MSGLICLLPIKVGHVVRAGYLGLAGLAGFGQAFRLLKIVVPTIGLSSYPVLVGDCYSLFRQHHIYFMSRIIKILVDLAPARKA